MKRSAFVVVALALAATAVFSKVSPMALEELFWESEIVAIGYDARLFREHGWQVAEFSITRVLKGSAEPRAVYYLADRTWACDISTASLGERSLIFLRRMGTPSRERIAGFYSPGSPSEEREPVPETVGEHPLYLISDSGRGRMPIHKSREKESVKLMLVDLDLPQPLRKLAFDVSEYEITASVPLKAMESTLRGLPLEAPPPTSTPTYAPLPPEKLRPIPENEP